MEWLRIETLLEAVVRWMWLKPKGPRVIPLDLRPGHRPQLIAGTRRGAVVVALDEQRLRTYARRFAFDPACRWILHEVRQAPAA